MLHKTGMLHSKWKTYGNTNNEVKK